MEMVPQHYETHVCPNCGETLPTMAAYCPGCSQKVKAGLPTFREMMAEVFEAIFNFESRTWKTFMLLFIPGELTNNYVAGKRRCYISPIRLFLIMAVVHFAALAFYVNQQAGDFLEQDTRKRTKKAMELSFAHELDSARVKVLADFPQSKVAPAVMDSLYLKLGWAHSDSVNLGYLKIGSVTQSEELKVSKEDLYLLSTGDLLDKYQVEGLIRRTQVGQFARIMKEPDSLTKSLIGNLTWMVFLMMPALALILKLLYIRRKRLYMEHLIFSFHYHAFAFLVISLGLFLGNVGILLTFALVAIYLFIAMKRVYKQSVWKTFLKYNALNFSYLFLFTFFLTLTFLVSAVLF